MSRLSFQVRLAHFSSSLLQNPETFPDPSDLHFPYHFFLFSDLSVLEFYFRPLPLLTVMEQNLSKALKLLEIYLSSFLFYFHLSQSCNYFPFPMIFFLLDLIQITEIACLRYLQFPMFLFNQHYKFIALLWAYSIIESLKDNTKIE